MKCCDLYSGMLRQSIIIEEEVKTKNDSGGHDIAWVTKLTTKAYIKPKSGYERLRGMQLESSVTHDVFIRYVPGVLAKQRINFNGRYFQIRAPLNLEEKNRWYQLLCEEGVAQ